MRRLNIRDIAELAGVSRQTVSRVINNSPNVSDKKKALVQAIIEEHNYIPNKSARSHFSESSGNIGVIISDITNPFFAEFNRGVQDQALLNNYNVFFCNTDNSLENEQTALRKLTEQSVDGIIMFSTQIEPEHLEKFAHPYQPLVSVNRLIDKPYIAVTRAQIREGAQAAVQHLISQGCHNIGFLCRSDLNSPTESLRGKGYQQALSMANIEFDSSKMIQTSENDTGGYTATQHLLAQHPDLDGLFCYNDIMAIGAMKACHEKGLNVPNDIKIMGFDGIELGTLITPSLSTIAIDQYQLGLHAFQQLQSLRNEESPNTRCLPYTLHIRDST